MTDTYHYDFYDQRALNKFSLEAYVDQLSNPFEPAVDSLIESHLGKINELDKSYDELEKDLVISDEPEDIHRQKFEQGCVLMHRNWLIDEIIALG